MVASPTLAHGFASRVAFGNFPALTSIEHGLAAKHGTLGSGSLDAFIASLANQLALELVKSAHHREDQLAMGRRGVEPWIVQCFDVGTGVSRRPNKSRIDRANLSSLTVTTCRLGAAP
jgi:hypothetical protein